ncbi:thiamine diphosphokinase [Taibaiella sp. KBW10]|uniref:thiamine diphosphokinase n=1 Tax=Taibaiella sp. KBW10 TaxID=2153357 RepID=UPI000F5B684F|nr:thiamine diphosphokinase [Taibaiella sp. KBW10]RQO29641.1 thiamine diphosphokinase [Taibaiella sp. KBW10]
MSSHHIIRENQEPALIIANGEACSMDLLNELLEWSPLVVVLDSAMERVMELGIKVDVLIGDFDRDFDAHYYREKQYPIEIIHQADQESTDLEKAFHYLLSRNFTAVNVVWATGKRADHAFTNISNIVRFRDRLKIVLFDDYSKIYTIPYTFEKWYAAQTIISLIPIGTVHGISTQNLLYPLDNETLTVGYRTGSSNRVKEDGFVKITYTDGDLLMMECHD